MADEKDSAPRARPFTPPLPPFRGSAAAARPPINPLTPPESRRGSLFIGTRTPSKSAAPESDAIDIGQLAPEPVVEVASPAPDAAPLGSADAASPEGASPESGSPEGPSPELSRSEAVAATEAMPWLFADPATADRRPTPGVPLSVITNAIAAGDEAAPEEAAQALSGLPYFDQSGEAHKPEPEPHLPRLSGRMHRVEFDAAGVLESIAARVRSGDIDVGPLDPTAGDAAALATVLAALLRQRAK
jgi:hypothetical protein